MVVVEASLAPQPSVMSVNLIVTLTVTLPLTLSLTLSLTRTLTLALTLTLTLFPFRNVFRAYWSMATVLALMELHSKERGFEYDAVVLARPDVWFHTDTDLPRQGMSSFLNVFLIHVSGIRLLVVLRCFFLHCIVGRGLASCV